MGKLSNHSDPSPWPSSNEMVPYWWDQSISGPYKWLAQEEVRGMPSQRKLWYPQWYLQHCTEATLAASSRSGYSDTTVGGLSMGSSGMLLQHHRGGWYHGMCIFNEGRQVPGLSVLCCCLYLNSSVSDVHYKKPVQQIDHQVPPKKSYFTALLLMISIFSAVDIQCYYVNK